MLFSTSSCLSIEVVLSNINRNSGSETRRLPQATASTLYRKLDDTLKEIGFTEGIRDIFRPAYTDAEGGGRPGIDPAAYFKMLLIGVFETLPSVPASKGSLF